MLIPLLLLFLGFFTKESIQRKLVKNKIPFEYLITRNSSNVSVPMDKPFDKESSDFFDSFCEGVDCYAAVFKDDTKTQYYQMLRNLVNDGFDLSFKFGLNFTESDYLYTIAFFLDDGGLNTCDAGSKNLEFTIPDCPYGNMNGFPRYTNDYQSWFSFTRSNGRIYCYILSDKIYNRADGINFCQSIRTNITGFQTVEEREFLNTKLMVIPTIRYTSNGQNLKFRVQIGAERKNDPASCTETTTSSPGENSQTCDKTAFFWYDHIPLNGESKLVDFVDSDNVYKDIPPEMCLTFQDNNVLSDLMCDIELQVLCGEYADVLAETRTTLKSSDQ